MKANRQSLGWYAVIIISIFMGLISGCATVPKASPAAREQALSFKPPPNNAGVYIICPYYLLGGQALWDFCLDRQNSTSLKISSFIYTPVWPGEHTVSSPDSENHACLTFVVNKGQSCFITVGPSFSGNQFKVISPEAGENYVRKYELSGDNFYQLPFMPGTLDPLTPATCHILLSQDDPFVIPQIDHIESGNHPSGTSVSPGATPAQAGEQAGVELGAYFLAGFVEAIANNVINNKNAATANKLSLALQGHGLGESFRTNFQSSLAQTVADSPWLHLTTIDLIRDNTNRTMSEINLHPVVQINLIYGLSPDASALLMRAELLYFRQGETNAAYDCLYTYLSQMLPVENKKAIILWSASNATLLRQRMNEGMSELITMIDLDFFHRARMNPNVRSIVISHVDPFAGRRVNSHGFVLRNEGQRIIFKNRGGNLFSVIGTVTPPPSPPLDAEGKPLFDVYESGAQ